MNDNVYKTDFIAWFNYHYIHGVHGYFGGSCEKKKPKCFLAILPSHPHTYPMKPLFIGVSMVRVSVRDGESKCEG